MKHSWKTWLLILPAVLLLILVIFVDIAFYRVPSIINLFRFEREIAICLIFICLLPIVRQIFFTIKSTPQRNLIIHAATVFGLELMLILPQIFFKKYLNLWDDNPFLAEFPFIWVTVSGLIAVVFVAGLIFALMNVKPLVYYRRRGKSEFIYHLLIGSLLLAAVVFNFTENRYDFRPMTILNTRLMPFLWLIAGCYGGIFFLNARFTQWLTAFNRREKFIASILGLLVVSSGMLIYFSRLLTPVYAYSVSVKGFALAALTFLLFFSIIAEGALLLSLPGAAFYDRLTHQMSSIGDMGRMVHSGSDFRKITEFIVKCIMEITRSDFGWIEIIDRQTGQYGISATRGIPDTFTTNEQILSQFSLSEILKPPLKTLIIDNIYKDQRTIKMRLMQAPWRSLLAMPILSANTLIGIVYIGKENAYGFSQDDEQILEPLVVQAGINLEKAANSDQTSGERKSRSISDSPNSVNTITLGGWQFAFSDIKQENLWNVIDCGKNRYGFFLLNLSNGWRHPVILKSEIDSSFRTLFKLETSPIEIQVKIFDLFDELAKDGTLSNLLVGVFYPEKGFLDWSATEPCLVARADRSAGKIHFRPIPGRRTNHRTVLSSVEPGAIIHGVRSISRKERLDEIMIDALEKPLPAIQNAWKTALCTAEPGILNFIIWICEKEKADQDSRSGLTI